MSIVLNMMQETRHGEDVSEHTFAAEFSVLNGLIVTGIWNESLARIEF